MIWNWEIPDYYPNKRIGIYESVDIDNFMFKSCKYISKTEIKDIPLIKFDCKKKYLYDVLPNNKMLLVVSDKVKSLLLEKCTNQIQFINVNILVENEILNNYFIMNILNEIDILDKEKSVYKKIPNTDVIISFRKIIYKQEDIAPFHIVRNKDCKSHILVSNEIKELFEKNKIKSVFF